MIEFNSPIIRVVSDWHMGNGGRSDDFLGWDDLTAQFLEKCIDENATVVYAGDTMDIWQSPFQDIIRKHSRVWKLMKAAAGVYLLGNHDRDIQMFTNGSVSIRRYFISDGLLVMHGDEFDRFNRPGSWIGEFLTKVAGVIEYVYPNVDKMKIWRSDKDVVRYNQSVAHLALDMGCLLGVYGHTHKEGFWEVKVQHGRAQISTVKIFNSGSITTGKFPYVEVVGGCARVMYM